MQFTTAIIKFEPISRNYKMRHFMPWSTWWFFKCILHVDMTCSGSTKQN